MAGFEGCAFSLEAPGNSHDAQAAGLAQQRLWQCAQVDQQYGWPSTQQNVYQADYSHRLGVGLRPPHDTESTYGDSQNGPVKFYHGVEFGLDRYGNWFPLQSQAGQEPYNPNGPYPTREMIRRYSTYVGSTVIDRRYYVNEFLNPQEPAVSIPTLKENVPMDFAD